MVPFSLLLLWACAEKQGPASENVEAPPVDSPPPVERWPVHLRVLLDGLPTEGVRVMQGGGTQLWWTDRNGEVLVEMDASIPGDHYLVASHPEARVGGVEVPDPSVGRAEITLTRYDPTDNTAYIFADPGPLDHAQTDTSQCGHCHPSLIADWFPSPHRTSASNPVVQDVYGGTSVNLDTMELCLAAGGTRGEVREPGTGATVQRCRMGISVAETGSFGACADCHAPGIDGPLGGRDLLEATGVAYNSGVHCDVCHHVESVDMEAAPGVGGRLHLVRPSEPATSAGMGPWKPLSFGPLADVLNPRMGSVLREEFHEAEFCGGCHEQEAAPLVGQVDPLRWPAGLLPIHSTFSEWQAGPMNPAAPCQSCHMPPKPEVGNAADLYNVFQDVIVGVSAGWERTPGEVRSHSWWGPRQPEAKMLELAASVSVDATVVEGELQARVTVKNVGPGHAIPTGEPLRNLILRVEAWCDQQPLLATGGAVVPDFGGWLDRQEAGADWSRWPGASVGQVIRVVRRTGEWYNYLGFGPFGDGHFSAAEKGMPVEVFAGEATIIATQGEFVTLDRPIPEGDIAYRGETSSLPVTGDGARAVAGAPGFAFARVLVGEGGERMVPHFLAVDVASDNRLLPQTSWTSSHTFAASCEKPVVKAVLIHRAWPLDLARQRAWPLTESVMGEAEW
ncbi:MAG TPA: multiheme c-type cytochrome [Myxococcota bacterium]|nr:multiheme c-type cytochrome [Myxococcota bacterium]